MQFVNSPSLIKKQKNKLDPTDDDPIQPDDDRTPRHQIGTTVHKCFNDIECEGKSVNHNHIDQPCQIPHSDGDWEQMWHNEVKEQHLLHTRNPKKVKKQHVNQILTKLAPTELNEDSHLPEFDIATIRAITAIKFGDATADAASDEEIRQLCIQTLGSNSTTPKEQALGRFTRRKLKSSSNWNAWKKGEHKQLD